MKKILDLRNFDFLQKLLAPGLTILQKMTNFKIYFFLHFFLLIFFLNILKSTPIEFSHRKWKKIMDLRNFDFLQKLLCPGLKILRKMTNFIISTFLHFFRE